MKKVTAVGLMLFAAQSFAMETGSSAVNSHSNLGLKSVAEKKIESVPQGWCSNIPLSYQDARAMGLKCN
ncbi:hypothetical protein [Pseudomonas chlororaphis]|uniref:hypothetical protein n=1 Tax=Pseudomonas chlororaphis TaxID=587753 RepID=UPI0011D06D7B|nr:hypothetical protein [Pseudomonas chlororaphis]